MGGSKNLPDCFVALCESNPARPSQPLRKTDLPTVWRPRAEGIAWSVYADRINDSVNSGTLAQDASHDSKELPAVEKPVLPCYRPLILSVRSVWQRVRFSPSQSHGVATPGLWQPRGFAREFQSVIVTLPQIPNPQSEIHALSAYPACVD